MKSEISALLDSELDDHAAARVCTALCTDDTLRGVWDEYCLIGDVMRRTYGLRPAFTRSVMERLASEPVVMAPGAIRKPRKLLNFALPIAASVLGAAVVAWFSLPPGAQSEQGAGALAPVVQTVPVMAGPVHAPPGVPASGSIEQLPSGEPVAAYLIVHQGYAAGRGIQGVAPYVRAVSETAQGGER